MVKCSLNFSFWAQNKDLRSHSVCPFCLTALLVRWSLHCFDKCLFNDRKVESNLKVKAESCCGCQNGCSYKWSEQTRTCTSSLVLFFHRATSDKVGELLGDTSERLPQTAEPPRIWWGHHPSGPCLRQGGWSQAGHEVQVGGRIPLLPLVSIYLRSWLTD